MRLVNLTPHTLTFLPECPSGPRVEVPPSGVVARCATRRERVEEVVIDGVGVPVNRTEFGELEGLPEPEEGVLYVVSALAGQAAARAGREDVLVVDDLVRDSEGRVVGARALALP